MTFVFVEVDDSIEDEPLDCYVVAILGEDEPENENHLPEVDIIKEEIQCTGILDSLFDNEVPAPGLYLISCQYWSSQDYYGEWDGGIEHDELPVRWQDGLVAQNKFNKVLDAYERKIRETFQADEVGAWRQKGRKNSIIEKVALWSDVCRQVVLAQEALHRKNNPEKYTIPSGGTKFTATVTNVQIDERALIKALGLDKATPDKEEK